MLIFIILGIIFQILFIYKNILLCEIPIHYIKLHLNNNIFQNYSFQSKTKLYDYHHDPMHNHLNIYPNLTNKLNTYKYDYDYKSPFFFSSTSKIQLQNDSINMFRSFHHKQHNKKNRENSSFVQLGIDNILSKKVINFGIGNRYILSNTYTIGYNTFYCCPINYYQYNNNPYSITLGLECWYHNILFTLNNYYNLNNFFSSEKTLQEDNIHNPKISYQICVQGKFPYLSTVIGKIKLEQLFYTKKKQNFLNKKNSNYYLSLNLNYQPIPILGFNINNIFTNKRYRSIYQIELNYQFGIPIKQQINYINKQNKLLSDHLNTIVEPFAPTVVQLNNYVKTPTNNKHLQNIPCSQQNMQILIGYPGEIKTINTKDHSKFKSKKWNFQLLQNKGGKIILLPDNTYAIYFPNNAVAKKDEIYILYDNNGKHSSLDHKKQEEKICVLVNDILQKQSLHIQQQQDIGTIDSNSDDVINFTENATTNLPLTDNNKEYCCQIDDIPIMDTINEHHLITKTEEDDDFLFPKPPPFPILLASLQQDTTNTLIEKSTSNNTLSSSHLMLNDTNDLVYSEKNEYEKIYNASIEYLETKSPDQNENLSHLLSKHKQTKFSSVGTKEYINKLEQTILERKKTKKFSSNNMEKILSRLRITQSSSSLNEDYNTDNSNDSFDSAN